MSVTLPSFTKTATFDVGVSETVDRLNQGQGNTKDIVEGAKAIEKVRTVVAASTVTGTQNNYDVDALAVSPDVGIGILNWNGASGVTFNGFAGGLSGRSVRVQNSSAAQTLTITNENASSTAANRCTCELSLDVVVRPGGSVTLWYDGVASRWRVGGLSNYAEGTFTPTITLGSGSVTYSAQAGSWVRVGRMVTFTVNITVNVATGPGGAMTIGTLPFTSAAFHFPVSIVADGFAAGATTQLMAQVDTGSTVIHIFKYSAGGVADVGGFVQNSLIVRVAGSYLMA